MHVEPLAVKVVQVDGKPYLCTVYPPAEPRPGDDVWGQRLRNHPHHRYTGDDDSASTTLNYAITKQDQEN
jgi:hypothetical protein